MKKKNNLFFFLRVAHPVFGRVFWTSLISSPLIQIHIDRYPKAHGNKET